VRVLASKRMETAARSLWHNDVLNVCRMARILLFDPHFSGFGPASDFSSQTLKEIFA